MCAELPQDQHLLNFFQRELCVARITTSANTLFCNERSGYHKSPATMISKLKQYLKYLQAKIVLFSKPFHQKSRNLNLLSFPPIKPRTISRLLSQRITVNPALSCEYTVKSTTLLLMLLLKVQYFCQKYKITVKKYNIIHKESQIYILPYIN